MLNNFPVMYLGTTVGHIHFKEAGLYWNYEGNFNMKQEGIYRIYGSCPNELINLGVCSPNRDIWHVRGKISKNKIDLANVSFVVIAQRTTVRFIPLNDVNHFEALEQLDTCKFEIRESCCGVIVSAGNQLSS